MPQARARRVSGHRAGGLGSMTTRDLLELVDELATHVVLAEPEPASLMQLADLLEEVGQHLGTRTPAAITADIRQAAADVRRSVTLDHPARETSLAAASASVQRLQQALREPPRPEPVEIPQDPAAPTPTGVAPVRKAGRDQDTVEILQALIDDTEAGLDRADEMLVRGEHEGFDDEQVNALFRVFHSIKGLSGHLADITELVALSHEAESLLDLVRQKKVRLEGEVLDALLAATSLARDMLELLAQALASDGPVASAPALDRVMAQLRNAVTDNDEPPAAPPPASVPQPSSGASSAPAPDPAPASAAAHPERPHEWLRLDAQRVDGILEMVGELMVVQSMIAHAPEFQGASSRLRNDLGQFNRISRALQDAAMKLRMVPVRGVFKRMLRVARELSHKAGKDAVLSYSGEATEVDRGLVDAMEQPLVHLVRNAIDHGLEPAAERVRLGKTTAGQIHLKAYHHAGSMVVEVSDDGRGLRRDVILRKARDLGLAAPDQQLTDAEIDSFIFAPGFSTAERVTEISGRGVGMDVVKRTLDAIRGRVTVSSTPGRGTTFRMVIPLTLAIIDGMVVACADERYVIPTTAVVGLIHPTREMVVHPPGRDPVLSLREGTVPLLPVGRLFRAVGARELPTEAIVILVEYMGRKHGIMVDHVVATQQVVIKPLGPEARGDAFFTGAAILPDGHVALIINVDRICTTRLPGRNNHTAAAMPAVNASQEGRTT
jgi:two-component system chemotaxis sensor kinase CheA